MAKSEPSLADEARNLKMKGPRSYVEEVRDQLDPKLRAEFVAAINDPTVPAAGLSRAMRARGYKLTSASIRHWRGSDRVLA